MRQESSRATGPGSCRSPRFLIPYLTPPSPSTESGRLSDPVPGCPAGAAGQAPELGLGPPDDPANSLRRDAAPDHALEPRLLARVDAAAREEHPHHPLTRRAVA